MNEVKQPSDDNITIGSLAKAAGVNVETIRNYQRIGLVDEPDKPAQGYRHYLHLSLIVFNSSNVPRIRDSPSRRLRIFSLSK